MKNYTKKILLATITSLLLSAGFTQAASRVEMVIGGETARSTISIASEDGANTKPCLGRDYR